MAVTSGFFNSDAGDRVYDAEDFNEFLDGIMAEGVLSTIGDSFIVSPSTGLQIAIGSGRAWFLKSWLTNSADYFLVHDTAHPTYDRIDLVVLDFDKSLSVRDNTIKIVAGTPSGSPTQPALIDTEDHLQIKIAAVDIAANATTISAGDITNYVGTTSCPFATGLIDQIDITDLLNQWDNEFAVWLAGKEADIAALDNGDALLELADIRDRYMPRNILINGDFQIWQRSTNATGIVSDANRQYVAADRWAIDTLNNGQWQIFKDPDDMPYMDSNPYMWVTLQGSAETPSAADYTRLVQVIETERLFGWKRGQTDCQELTLTFKINTSITGTFIVEAYLADGMSISFPVTVATPNVWQDVEITIPPETSTVWDYVNKESGGMYLYFWLSAGSNFTGGGSLQTAWGAVTTNKRAYGQTNLTATIGNDFKIMDVQLEVGSFASIFERTPYQKALETCRRYYEKYDEQYRGIAIATSTTELTYWGENHLIPKWKIPTAVYGSGSVYVGATPYTITDVDDSYYTQTLFIPNPRIRPTFDITIGSAVLTVGNLYQFVLSNVAWDAEM